MGSKSKAPPPPDYTALALTQGQLTKEAVDAQTKANRVNQYTPEGSLTWSQDANGNWTQTTAYSPEQQAMYKNQMDVQQGLSDTSRGLLGNVQASVKDPFSYEGMPDVQDYDFSKLADYGEIDPNEAGFGAVEQVRDAMMSRLRPQLEQQRQAEQQRLAAQGVTQGSEPYSGVMSLQGQKENDAEQQALLGAAGEYGNIWNRKLQAANYANSLRGQQLAEQGVGRGASIEDRTRAIQEALALRQMPLNELNAFMSGSQVAQPQFGSYNTAGYAAPADMAGAADKAYQAQMSDYNAKQASKAATTGGLLKMAGTIGGSFFGPLGSAAGSALGGMLASKVAPG